ncbi:MAG: acyltransferase [Sphingomonadales bacterium]|nr:acyltransferase [Sphingomonadales bacterium]
MELAGKPSRFGKHHNAFGFLRLLFASLVIVSHVPEIIDVGPQREILHRLTGTITFGNFAVYGFFVISGYLITGSLLGSNSIAAYARKRAARIYPGFAAASLVCLLVVAPLSGAAFSGPAWRTAAISVVRIVLLARPVAEHPFAGQTYSGDAVGLNGAMWTIQYEAACYAVVVLLMVMGLLRNRWLTPALAAALILIGTFGENHLPWWLSHGILFPGAPDQIFTLSGIFLAGASFYLYRDEIGFRPALVCLCAALFVATLFDRHTVAFGYAIFGSYLIFAAAKAGAGNWIGRINDRNDVSYGVYLYAWPAEQLLIRYFGTRHLILLAVLTWIAAAIMGWISWKIVESPALKLIGRSAPQKAPASGC